MFFFFKLYTTDRYRIYVGMCLTESYLMFVLRVLVKLINIGLCILLKLPSSADRRHAKSYHPPAQRCNSWPRQLLQFIASSNRELLNWPDNLNVLYRPASFYASLKRKSLLLEAEKNDTCLYKHMITMDCTCV